MPSPIKKSKKRRIITKNKYQNKTRKLLKHKKYSLKLKIKRNYK